MNSTAKQQLRKFIEEALASHADRSNLANNESLFVSGRLDSFTMLNLVMYLEQNFGVDFSYDEFEVELIDSVDAIESLVDSQAGK
jgi:acyl carrier protein